MSFSSTHTETEQKLVLVSKKTVAQDILEFEFQNASGALLPSWEAGSHIDLKLSNGMSRQYSLMQGVINTNNWRVAVLIEREGRGGSLLLEQLEIGSTLFSLGPRNHFPLTSANRYLFIAGGIGITPLIKMIQTAEEIEIPWELAYLGRAPETMSYADELLKNYGEKVRLFVKSQGQRFDVHKELSSLGEDTQVFSCGPERLMLALEEWDASSVESRVHIERFHPREILMDQPDEEFVVLCEKSGEELVVPADESLLMAADFAGIEISGDCMEGTCGACETRVIKGEIIHKDSVLSPQARAQGDTMMICVSRGRGKIVLDL